MLQDKDVQSTSSHAKKINLETRECLMLKITLLKVPTYKEPLQIRSLFRTTCKVSDKVCKVIFYSSSTDNLASKEMVDKLGLQTIPHPYPYRVSWLNKEQHVLISEQVWVYFQIGEYKDKK